MQNMNLLGNRAPHCPPTTSGRPLAPPSALCTRHSSSKHAHRQLQHQPRVPQPPSRPCVSVHAKRAGSAAPAADAPEQKKAEITDEAPIILERGAPLMPRPSQFQQTLQRSFTLGGMGLHSAEYATVRVRPACADEGRYFVRVPEGANKDRFKIQEPAQIEIDESGPLELSPEIEEMKLALYSQYLEAEEQEKFEGSFQDFLHAIEREDLVEQFESDPDFMKKAWEQQAAENGMEPIQARGQDEEVVPAHIDAAPEAPQAVALSLGDEAGGPNAIIGAELLLAALECCGVDNARIEIEGGRELPVLDGSALGWAMEIQFAGLRYAPPVSALGNQEEEEDPEPTARLVAQPEEMIVVREEDAFIMLMPEETMRQTVGIDCAENAPVIGKQWLSWCMYEDPHFRVELSPARRYLESPDEVLALHQMGWVQAGTEGIVLVGYGDRWYDTTMTRFVRDEPARHELCNLLGILALSAKPGHAGVPVGHVVQYKATLELQLNFVRALRDSLRPEDYVPVAYDVDEDDEALEEIEAQEDAEGEQQQ